MMDRSRFEPLLAHGMPLTLSHIPFHLSTIIH